ncbi:nodulation protein NfeD [Alcanivorax sp. CY1518]|uniref:Nodulation protein NfeD n=1 Tax=Alcanivorax quisquiliarum TaxID=2933565 RepID=A0ABT0E5I3_9GAMM|nr:nodulation protein NfeD [Alcanivorax quisquiliarum]
MNLSRHPVSRRRALFALYCLGVGALLALAGLAVRAAAPAPVVVLTVDGPIGPATSDYFQRALAQAQAEHQAQLVVMRLDTPGGLDTAMRDMVRAILASEVPVVGYVSPGGARAASAGTYLMYATHIAAMSPATHLGSATPVQIGGMPGQPETEEADSEPDDEGKRRGGTAMERKVLEDAVAYIRGLAERRGRNADWAERAVRDAVNLTAAEALEQGVVNIVARDLPDLLAQLDGYEVTINNDARILATSDVALVNIEPDWRHQLLAVITHPNIAYFLMLVGFYGIIFELASPGNIYPGVIGAICLVLALYAFQVLPVNYAGLALIVLGLLFIIGEAFLPSFGALGIGGVVSFVFGSVILMDDAHLAVSLPLIGGVALVAAGLMLWTMTRLWSLRRRPPQTGEEALVGATAVALGDFDGDGRVRVMGESWLASAAVPVREGDKLRVVAVEGLRLHVEPAGVAGSVSRKED